jgi:nucleotide-binding universal stress UspA family protein
MRLVRAYPYAQESQHTLERALPDGTLVRKRLEEISIDTGPVTAHLGVLKAKQPGVVVAREQARSALDILLGRGGSTAILCNKVGAPVLFPKGSAHHERVALCVAEGEVDLGAAEVALDLARLLSVPLHVRRVRLPSYLEPSDGTTDELIETFTRRARLHGLAPEISRLEGNPIVEWARASEPADLAVVARRRTTQDSFSKPDLALRLVRRAKCSVLVVTRGTETTAPIPRAAGST